MAGKRLALIKKAVPRVQRIAVLTTGEPSSKTQVEKARQAAPSLGVKLVVVEVRDADYDRAFATMVTEAAGALFVVANPVSTFTGSRFFSWPRSTGYPRSTIGARTRRKGA